MKEQRRLAAILVADVVGFSRLIGTDETGTLTRLATLRREIVHPNVTRYSGRLFKETGDGFLVEFASAVQAVTCAMEIQRTAGSDSLPLRIGIHVGDVVVQGDDLMGDGVNIAARIEGIAEPGGIAVSRAVHEQVRDRLAVAFDDRGEVELKNIGRPVHIFAIGGKTAPPTTALALPDKPSIAVLPFQNMSGDPEQEYFADGMVEDIITALSRFKSLFVIARNSTFTYKDKAVDVRQVGRELGVRYVLEGSVRKVGGKVRITGQLVDGTTGNHLWADKYDGDLANIFDLQDQITTSVVGAIAPKLDQAEIERARRKPVENLDAYDCHLRGMAYLSEGTKEADAQALGMFYQAIERDPTFATPYGMAALCYSNRKNRGWVVDGKVEEAETRRLAARASVIGGDDAHALCGAGQALVYVCRDYEAGAALVDRGLAINQNLAIGWQYRGWVSVFLGAHEAALEQFARALRLSPLDPRLFASERGIAAALLLLGKYKEATVWANTALAHQPDAPATMRIAATVQALAGNVDDARELATRAILLDPAVRISTLSDYLPHRRPQDVARFVEGLRLAGLPE